MKKKIVSILIILILLIYLFNTFTSSTQAVSIASVSQEKVGYGKDFYVILNLSAISFNKFKVEITNNEEMISKETTATIQNLSSSKVATTFVVDKSQVNLDKMGIVFISPEKETQIVFNIKITNLDVTQDTLKAQLTEIQNQITILNNTIKSLNDILEKEEDKTSDIYLETLNTKEEAEKSLSEKQSEKDKINNKLNSYAEETLSSQVSVQITKNVDTKQTDIDFNKDSNKTDENFTKDDIDMMKDKMKEMDKMNDEINLKMSNLESNLKQANDTISSLSQGTTYQGSSNNYLSNLSVKGYELDNTFDKTINDYFINVAKDVKSVNVTANAEDSSAIVTVVGNTDLKEGQNKIIVNITAEDASIRTYRIYVTK